MKKLITNMTSEKSDNVWKNYIEHLRESNTVLDWELCSKMKDAGIIILPVEYAKDKTFGSGIVQSIYDHTDIIPSVNEMIDTTLVMKIFGSVPPQESESKVFQALDSFSVVNGRPVYETVVSVYPGVFQYKGRCWKEEVFVPINNMVHLIIEDRNSSNTRIAIVYFDPFTKVVLKGIYAKHLDVSETMDIVRCIEARTKKNFVKDLEVIPLIGTMGGYINDF